MIKKYKNILILLFTFVSILMFATSLAFFSFVGKADDVSTLALDLELKEQYIRNEYLEVPKGEFSYQGEKIIANSCLTFPDGRTSAYSEICLDEEGIYTLSYTADVGNSKLEKDYQFRVVSKSSSLFATDSSVVFKNNYTSPEYTAAEYKGLFVSMKSNGTVLRYNGVIDLKDNTQSDTFFEFIFTPESNGEIEIQDLRVILRDIYDAENFLTIVIRPQTSGPYLFVTQVLAKANTEVDYGLIGNNPGSVAGKYGGYDTTASAHGTTEYLDETGNTSITTCVPLKLMFDYQEKALYASPSIIPNAVVDFDNSNLVGLGNEWGGFTTGEVYAEIILEKKIMSVESANIMILNVDGRDMGSEEFTDFSAPQINIDFKGNDEDDLPYALVGERFKIFNATVYDDVDGFVYYYDVDVYGEDGRPVIINNGYFIPTAVGEYTISYKASDKFGHSAVRNIKIQAYKENISSFDFEFVNPLDDVFVGLNYKIEDGFASGGSGVLKVERSLIFNGEEYEIADGYFKPLYEGEYYLSYILEDYLGNTATFTQTMVATFMNAPIIESFKLPISLLKGSTYNFPVVKAYDYEAAQEIYCDLFINGKKMNGYDFNLTEEGVITVKYVAFSAVNKNNYSVTDDYTINVKNLDKTNGTTFFSSYFDCENINLSAQKTNMVIETANIINKASFIRPVPVEAWTLMFDVDKAKNNFSAFAVTLTDSQNSEEQVRFIIYKNLNSAQVTSIFSINDRTQSTIAGSFYGNSKVPFKIALSDNEIFDYNKNYVSTIKQYANGKKFAGFTSGLVYVDFEFQGVKGESSIVLQQLSNQTFGETTDDRVAPVIVLEKQYSVFFIELNSTYTVYAAKAYDVLSATTFLEVEVISPNGTSLYKGDISKEKSFVFSENGKYTIVYTARDSVGGRKNTKTFYVSVADIKAPEITWIGEMSNVLNVGDTLKIPSFTFTDDYSKDVYSMIYVIEPSGKLVPINDGYKVSKTGRHTLWVCAIDDFGNITMKDFIFYVN